jgi:hypothetical protein
MKFLSNSLVFAMLLLAISFVFFSCSADDNGSEQSSSSSLNVQLSSSLQSSSSFELTEMPVMNSKVVSYVKISPIDCMTTPEKDVLKSAFPHVFEDEREECNYLALCLPSNIINNYYWILSEDMVLYQIMPRKGINCGGTEDGTQSAMLICDDTAEGNLMSKMVFNNESPFTYYDPDWVECRGDESRGVFF